MRGPLAILVFFFYTAVPLTLMLLCFGLSPVGSEAAGLGLPSLLLIGLWIVADGALGRAHGAMITPSAGLKKSFELVSNELGVRARLRVYPELAPIAWVARSPGRAATIYLSQGLSGQLSEAELRTVLRWGLVRCQGTRLLRDTFFALLAHLTLSAVAGSWRSVLLSGWQEPTVSDADGRLNRGRGSFSFLVFLILMPLVRACLRRALQAPRGSSARPLVGIVPGLKIAGMSYLPMQAPAAAGLYVVDPWSARMLFPQDSWSQSFPASI